jgi:DNA-binding transcriptional LysR family regulator
VSPDRLHAFLRVVELGTVSAAANELFIAQPALSRRLQALETETGLQLFRRQGGRLVVTPAGRAFESVARTLLHAQAQAQATVDQLRQGRVEKLVIAATGATIRGSLREFIAAMGADEPAVVVLQRAHHEVEGTLVDGADMAIVPGVPSPEYDAVELGRVTLRARVDPDHELAGRASIGLDVLAEQRLILPGAHSASRSILDEAFRQAGLRPHRVLECDDGPTLDALARSGHGVAVSTESPRPDVVLIPIEAPTSLALPLNATWTPEHFAAPILRDLALRLKQLIGGTSAA